MKNSVIPVSQLDLIFTKVFKNTGKILFMHIYTVIHKTSVAYDKYFLRIHRISRSLKYFFLLRLIIPTGRHAGAPRLWA